MAQRPESIFPELQQDLTPTTCGSTICSYSYNAGGDGPILVLIHGYPQSAYMWRYLIPELIPQYSIFVPELPGYGISTLPSPGQHSKRAVGKSILEALTSIFHLPDRSDRSAAPPRPLILIGHDRGARISHRLAVDEPNAPHVRITSLILMDIVPTAVQWAAFSHPQSGIAYFHWPFLSNVELASRMIEAYGGDRWCRDVLERSMGRSEEGRASFAMGEAKEVYARNFRRGEAVRGSCEDYRCGGGEEVAEQREDMQVGRKIGVPTLVVFSEEGLGRMHDVEAAWKGWVDDGVRYQARGIGGGRGHYLPEEDPKQIREVVLDWLKAEH